MLKAVSKLVSANQIITPITLAGNVTLSTGNLVIGTAGKGIDFSADPSAAGMTSELLDDYEEGTWTVQFFDDNNSGNVSPTSATGYYTKVGRLVTCNFSVDNIDTTGMTSANAIWVTLPFAPNASLGRNLGNILLNLVTFPASRTEASVLITPTNTRANIYGSGTNLEIAPFTVGAFTSGSDDIAGCTLSYCV